MKRKLTKTEFEALNEVLKSEYEEKNGAYFAKIEDDDEAITSIRQAKENEVLAHKETKKKLKEYEDKARQSEEDNHRKTGDVEALEKSWKEKFTTRESELLSELGKSKSLIVNSMKDSALTTLAAKLVKPDASRIFKKAIAERFDVEMLETGSKLRILDKEGKPSAMTMDDFEKEILADKEFSSIIVASRASGTGSSNTSKHGAGSTQLNTEKPLRLQSPSELAAMVKSQKEGK